MHTFHTHPSLQETKRERERESECDITTTAVDRRVKKYGRKIKRSYQKDFSQW
jgi:hypothetical protein